MIVIGYFVLSFNTWSDISKFPGNSILSWCACPAHLLLSFLQVYMGGNVSIIREVRKHGIYNRTYGAYERCRVPKWPGLSPRQSNVKPTHRQSIHAGIWPSFFNSIGVFLISYASGFSLAALSLSMGMLCMRFSGVILGRSKIVDSCYLVVFMSFSMPL